MRRRVFHLDERIYGWWSPEPPIGSLYQVNAIMRVDHQQPRVDHQQATGRTDVQMVVELQNSNSQLLEYHCELRATVNGKDLDHPIIFDGYANANNRTSLIVNMPDVPILAIIHGDRGRRARRCRSLGGHRMAVAGRS